MFISILTVLSLWSVRTALDPWSRPTSRMDICRGNGTCTTPTIPLNGTCAYPDDIFKLLINLQCPAATPLCIIDQPYVLLASLRHRCSTAPRLANNTLKVLRAAQLLSLITQDPGFPTGISNCMLTVFYSPECIFSKKVAPLVGLIPKLYPQLIVVATDVSEHTKLNTRYGIIATPTVLLWVDGVPVARMDEAPFTIEAFRNYIEKCTDLEASQSSMMAKDEEFVKILDIKSRVVKTDWQLWMSWISFILSASYFFCISKYGQNCWEMLRGNYIEANEVNQHNAMADEVVNEIMNESTDDIANISNSIDGTVVANQRESSAQSSSSYCS